MFSLFALFKFVHVAAVIIWIGGVCTLTMLNLRLTREQDRAVLPALLRQGNFYGAAIISPAAVLTLVAGIATAANVGFPFSSLWISWGFIAIFASLILGATLIRMANSKLLKLASDTTTDITEIRAAQRQLGLLNLINILLLLSTVWAMVFKPTL